MMFLIGFIILVVEISTQKHHWNAYAETPGFIDKEWFFETLTIITSTF